MKRSWRVEVIQLAIIAGMFAVSVWAWPYVPDRLPVHWNLQGDVDRYGGKFEGLFLLPLVTLGLYFLLMIVPYFDPGRRNYQNFRKAYNVIRVVLVLFMALIYGLMILSAFGYQGDTTMVVLLALGALFIVLGNFMGKLRPNWFVGVRTPWTLSSKLSWDKTHRLAGWLFVLMGALLMLLALVQTTWTFITVFTINGLCILWMVVYSYLVYRSDPNRTSPAATMPGNE